MEVLVTLLDINFMEDLLPEQKKQLGAWVVQRDAILDSIAKKRVEEQGLIDSVKTLSDSETDLSNRIQQSIGRIVELDSVEKKRVDLVSKEIVDLESQKTRLETEVEFYKKDIESMKIEKGELAKDIVLLMQAHDSVFSRMSILETIIEHITRTNSLNVGDLEKSVSQLIEKVQTILNQSTIHLDAHTKILGDIPKLFVELRRTSMEREVINKHK